MALNDMPDPHGPNCGNLLCAGVRLFEASRMLALLRVRNPSPHRLARPLSAQQPASKLGRPARSRQRVRGES
eukprot:15480470-Alexandrium_andersonii.AAC.1